MVKLGFDSSLLINTIVYWNKYKALLFVMVCYG